VTLNGELLRIFLRRKQRSASWVGQSGRPFFPVRQGVRRGIQKNEKEVHAWLTN